MAAKGYKSDRIRTPKKGGYSCLLLLLIRAESAKLFPWSALLNIPPTTTLVPKGRRFLDISFTPRAIKLMTFCPTDAFTNKEINGSGAMLKRVLEPEVMDTPEEAIAYDEMDHSEVNRRFVADLLAAGLADLDLGGVDGLAHRPAQGVVMDLGTGTALIPIELCQQHPDVRVLGIDLSVEMLDVARMNIDMASMLERIQLQHLDAKGLPSEDDQFVAVISNSIIHHIPEPAGVLREALRVLAPGGMIYFRDLMRPPDETTLQTFLDTYAEGESELAREMFANSLRAALTLDEMVQLVGQSGFEPETLQATSDRHWTWCAWKRD